MVLRACIDNVGAPTQSDSELTYYRKMAQVLDIILEDTYLDLKE